MMVLRRPVITNPDAISSPRSKPAYLSHAYRAIQPRRKAIPIRMDPN